MIITLGHKEQPSLRHPVCHAGKKVPGEVGRVAVFQVGALVAAVEEVPVGRADVRAARPAKRHPSLGHATALLAENPSPTEEEVKVALQGNICRCTGYWNIVEAVVAAGRGSA